MSEQWSDGRVLRSLHPRQDLATAEGILVLLRGCDLGAAFDELVQAATRHRVPTLTIASGLVDLASGDSAPPDDARPGHAAAAQEWGQSIRQLRELLPGEGGRHTERR